MRWTPAPLLLGLLGASVSAVGQVQPNGRIDNIYELMTCREYWFRMRDGIRLATDVCMPILQDDWSIDSMTVMWNGVPVTLNRIVLARKGTQIFWNPGQPDPFRLSAVFSRTPYGKHNYAFQHAVIILLGYVSIVQDTRGRYRSEGVYLPMFNDNWDKSPYIPPGWTHPLDITGTAHTQEDGYDALIWLRDSARWSYDDTLLEWTDPPLTNDRVCMIGASALGNTQYYAVAAQGPPSNLRCLIPQVAGGEQWILGHFNGMFREQLITGWLKGVLADYAWDPDPVGDPSDTLHTLLDYPAPYNSSPVTLWQAYVDFWSVWEGAHYSWTWVRKLIDVGAARLPDGSSRYRNLDLPILHINGWWDIYNVSQLLTWLLVRQHCSSSCPYQKLIMGPWTHQTIARRRVGDRTFPANVYRPLSPGLDPTGGGYNVAQVFASSQIVQWLRRWLGVPEFFLPPQPDWQFLTVLGQDSIFIQIPADTYSVPYFRFFNFLNGVDSLPGVPVRLKGGAFDSAQILYISFPPPSQSLLGDTTGTRMTDTLYVFHEDSAGGIPALQLYVAGPDSTEGGPGNWWMGTDTFPPRGIQWVRLYWHPAGKLTRQLPGTSAVLSFYSDPYNPVQTIGGPNMLVRTPAGPNRLNQGPMQMNHPLWESLTYPDSVVLSSGEVLPQILVFETEPLPDTLCIIGFPRVRVYASGVVLDSVVVDSLDMDLVVRIIDVFPDGREYYVTECAVNGLAREWAKAFARGDWLADTVPWSNLASGTVYEFEFAGFPVAYTFGRGHRIKIVVSGSSWPLYQSNPHIPQEPGQFFRVSLSEMGMRVDTFRGVPVRPRPAIQSIHLGPGMEAYLELPVWGPTPWTSTGPDEGENGFSPDPDSEIQVRIWRGHNAIWIARDLYQEQIWVEIYTLPGARIQRTSVYGPGIHRITLPENTAGLPLFVRIRNSAGGTYHVILPPSWF